MSTPFGQKRLGLTMEIRGPGGCMDNKSYGWRLSLREIAGCGYFKVWQVRYFLYYTPRSPHPNQQPPYDFSHVLYHI